MFINNLDKPRKMDKMKTISTNFVKGINVVCFVSHPSVSIFGNSGSQNTLFPCDLIFK